jgi:hypothetical protein
MTDYLSSLFNRFAPAGQGGAGSYLSSLFGGGGESRGPMGSMGLTPSSKYSGLNFSNPMTGYQQQPGGAGNFFSSLFNKAQGMLPSMSGLANQGAGMAANMGMSRLPQGAQQFAEQMKGTPVGQTGARGMEYGAQQLQPYLSGRAPAEFKDTSLGNFGSAMGNYAANRMPGRGPGFMGGLARGAGKLFDAGMGMSSRYTGYPSQQMMQTPFNQYGAAAGRYAGGRLDQAMSPYIPEGVRQSPWWQAPGQMLMGQQSQGQPQQQLRPTTVPGASRMQDMPVDAGESEMGDLTMQEAPPRAYPRGYPAGFGGMGGMGQGRY